MIPRIWSKNCLGSRWGKPRSAAMYALLGRSFEVFDKAAKRWFVMPGVAAAFCRFAMMPAGGELLLSGLRWLAIAEPNWPASAWEHDGLASALVVALRTALERHHGAIAADKTLR